MKISINDKSLYTGNIPIQQYNNLVDTITLTLPRVYNGIDMAEATARIVADGLPSLVEGVSDEITKAYTDTTITVMWDVARAYTETAGSVSCQMSLLDTEEYALYTAVFTLHVIDSLTFTEWDGEDHTMWDDYFTRFTELVTQAETIEAKMDSFDTTYAEKIQEIKDTGAVEVQEVKDEGTAQAEALQAIVSGAFVENQQKNIVITLG